MKAAAIAIASAYTVKEHVIKTDLSNWANSPKLMDNLIKSAGRFFDRKANKLTDSGAITWGNCDSETPAFHFDKDSTTVTPNPLTKGSTIQFDLVGTMDSTTEVDNIHVHVDWNGSSLYDEDDKDGQSYDSDYEFKLSWAVPSYAPDGTYAVKLTGTNASNSEVVCAMASFTF